MSVLKVFRTYNKWILAIGVSILMLAFLIQPTLQMFAPNPAKRVEGRINGEKVRTGDIQFAAQQLDILGSVSPLLRATAPEGPLQWILMQHEARSLGLGASEYEVDQLLKAFNTNLDQITTRLQKANIYVAQQDVAEAFASWVMVQRYKDLVLGVNQVPLNDLLGEYAQYDQFARQLMAFNPSRSAEVVAQIAQIIHGGPRVSEPLLKRFVYDQESQATVVMLPIKVDAILDKEPDPSPDAVKELFEQYKNDLEGQSKPYGFGYKEPEAVRLEYMTIPFARLRDTVKIKEDQTLEYYQRNKETFKVPGADKEKDPTKLDLFKPDEKEDPAAVPPKQYRTYEEVVNEIRDTLAAKEAEKLASQMAQAAYTILKQQASTLKRKDNYYVTAGADWKPMPFAEVAEQLQKRFGVLPDVVTIDDHWMDRKEVSGLGGVGEALLQRPPFGSVPAPAFIFSVKELLADNETSDLDPLQVGVASKPLFHNTNKNFYIVRVIDARKAGAPASIDKVQDKVREDARKLAAYKKIAAESDTWVRRGNSTTLKDLGEQLVVDLQTPLPFPRRKEGAAQLFEAPTIAGVGDSATFVKNVFAFIDNLPAGKKLDEIPPEQRIIAAPDALMLTLWLVRIDEYKPITEKQYESRAERGLPLAAAIRDAMAGDKQAYDPFSIDALSKRVGYKREQAEEEPDESEQKPEADATAAAAK